MAEGTVTRDKALVSHRRIQRLSGIFFRRGDVHIFRDIDQPTQSEGAIHQEPAYFGAGAVEFALKQIVEKPGGKRML